MGLVINQTYAKIGVQTTPASLRMQTQNARLDLHQKHAKVSIQTELPKVKIDQYEAFASAGLKGNVDLAKEGAQRGQQQAMEYIGKKATDGNQLAAIENGGSPIADIAERDAYPTHEFNIDFLPKVGPKITVEGSLKVQADANAQGTNNGVEGTYTPGDVSIDFNPASVNISLRQYASINIRYEASKVDTYV